MHHVCSVPASRRSLGVSILTTSVALSVLAAPLPAFAGTASSAFAARPSPFAPTGVQLRSVMSFQPEEAEGGGGGEAPAPAASEVEGPAPAPAAAAPAPAPVGPEPRKGLGLLITGSVLTGAFGLPLTSAGIALMVIGRAADDGSGVTTAAGGIGGAILLIPGIIFLGVGVPLLAVGAVKFKHWRRWKNGQQASFRPSGGRTMHGTWTAGLTVNF